MMFGATEPEPVNTVLIEMLIESGSMDDACVAYGNVITAIDDIGLDYSAMQTFVDMADAYLIVMMEGDENRLLPDARDVLTTWLHDHCS
jgi:hypothetical protein